jgi:multiple sugar transport system permease protein
VKNILSKISNIVGQKQKTDSSEDKSSEEQKPQDKTIKQDAIKNIKLKKTIGHEAKTNRTGYAFVAPFLVVFFIFNFWPTLNTFLVSFTDLKGFRNDYIFRNAKCPTCAGSGNVFVTDSMGQDVLDAAGNPMINVCPDCKGKKVITPISYNYGKLVKDKNFWGSLKNTFIIWTFNFIPQLGLALILAIWLSDTRLNLVGKGLFRTVIYMPNLLMAASVALLFRSLFGAAAHVNAPAHQFLRSIGINWMQTYVIDTGLLIEPFNFFRSIPFTRGLVAFIQWWMWYGHTLIMLMAGITSIPISLYESAVVDGANSRQTAWFITLPLLRPMILYILVTSMIGGMQMFEIPFLLTDMRGGPQYMIRTTAVYQYNMAFQGANDKAYGAAISIGIFVVTVILALLIFFFMQDRSELKKRKGGVR